MTLEEVFPILYDIACEKDAFVATHLDFSSGSLQWDVNFFSSGSRLVDGFLGFLLYFVVFP
jgi:hypothetical protein